MPSLVLLGDSILDNAPYVAPDPDTSERLRVLLGPDWTVELLAVDGAMMADVEGQLARMKGPADHAVLSVGGNDSTQHLDILTRAASSSAEVLGALSQIQTWFGERYEPVVEAVQARAHRVTLCTIYEPPLADPAMALLVRVPLTQLNDRILRAAAQRGLDVVDLRTYCTSEADFILEIEPSPAGARKIAEAIREAVQAADGDVAGRVFAGRLDRRATIG